MPRARSGARCGGSTRASGCRCSGALVSREWYEVGRFLGAEHPAASTRAIRSASVIELWRAAGIDAVQVAAHELRRRASSCGGRVRRWRRPRPRLERPAFYALRPGGWRDLVTLLHPPYTAWHLSYVALGAAAAPTLHGDRLVAALAAFFLAVGVARARARRAARAGRCGTRLSRPDAGRAGGRRAGGRGGDRHRRAPSIVSLPAGRRSSPSGAFIVVAYNLELFGGRFHTDFWFALAWGAFPALHRLLGRTRSRSASAGRARWPPAASC